MVFREAERAYLEAARVARLATADAGGCPHAVPVCFALVEGARRRSAADREPRSDHALVTPIDEKPKEVGPAELRRVRNVRENPRVALVADHWTEAWDGLGWVQVRGRASLVDPDGDGHAEAVAALRAKYDQYGAHALEERPVIRIDPGSVVSWGRLDP